MNDTLETQYLLHEGVTVCSLGLIRRAATEDDPSPPIQAVVLGRETMMEALNDSIPAVWPGFELDGDFESQLIAYQERALERLEEIRTEKGFVPAANWRGLDLGLLFEYLRVELDAIAIGVKMEPLWQSFWELEETESFGDVVEAGMEIKLRAVGDFLVGSTQKRFRDVELHAADFFEAGKWASIRDQAMVDLVARTNDRTSKQVAHLSIRRPYPSQRGRYRSSYDRRLERLIHVFRTFTDEVNKSLIPDWWDEWFTNLEATAGFDRFGTEDDI